jgi:hypothetical protein
MSTIWEIMKIIWIIITHAPEIWSLVKKIIEMINDIKDQEEQKEAWKDINNAAKIAKEKGDTSELEKVFKKWFPKRRMLS